MARPRMQGTEQLKFRIPADLKQRLQSSADNRGRSFNAEIVARLSQSLVRDSSGTDNVELDGLLAIVAAAMNAAGWAAGSFSTLTPQGAGNWLNNPIAYGQAMEAATQVLGAAAPPSEQALPLNEYMANVISPLGVGFANAILEEAASGNSRVNGTAERERAKALNSAIGETLVARFKAGEPRSPLVVQSFGSNFVLETSDPTVQIKPGAKK